MCLPRLIVPREHLALLTLWVGGVGSLARGVMCKVSASLVPSLVALTAAVLMIGAAQAEPKTKQASPPQNTSVPAPTPVQSALSADEPQALPSDELDKLLADKGLLGKITRVGQQVTQTVSSGASKVSSKASELVVSAMGALGVPYRRGGSSFDGFDCSGFVRAMVEQTAGLILPRKAEQQAAATQKIDKKDLQPGDLVFFNTMRRAFSHVGIYLGDGKFIHSPKPGAEVRVEDMGQPYWTRRFDGARRVQDGAE